MDDLFAPPGQQWRRVSPRLATERRLMLAVLLVVVLVLVALLGWSGLLPLGPVAALVVLLLGGSAWAWWGIGRSAANWGYAEQAEELHITSGAYFRKLVVVPYGRMQYVDVQAGPLEQLFGIVKVRLHTASPGTSARIPGLPTEEAARLRDRLTALGETQAAGL